MKHFIKPDLPEIGIVVILEYTQGNVIRETHAYLIATSQGLQWYECCCFPKPSSNLGLWAIDPRVLSWRELK